MVAGSDRVPKHVAGLRMPLSRQRAAQQRDRVRRQVREIGEGPLLHPVVVVAAALSEEDGSVCLSVLAGLDDGDVHACGLGHGSVLETSAY